MERVRKIAQHLLPAGVCGGQGGLPTPPMDLPEASASEVTSSTPLSELSMEKKMELAKVAQGYREGVDKLMADGTLPKMTIFDLALATHNESIGAAMNEYGNYVDNAQEAELQALSTMPGPWHDAPTREAKIELLRRLSLAEARGHDIHTFAALQQQYGDRGLGSNIAVPTIGVKGMGTTVDRRLIGRVIVADAEDAARISRIHVRKQGNFEPVLMDGVISTTDNDSWKAQRAHLGEAFLPLSSLAQILPKSLARAKHCAKRLAGLAEAQGEVDMSDFLLHEAQAQLQLALLGAPEELMEGTNEGIRAAFTGNSAVGKVGHLAESMRKLMELTQVDKTLGLPSDDRPVCGPLSRAVQASNFTKTADYGNMLLILFAGHDTTGHTMTWLLFELCRNPAVQLEVQAEVDAFFASLGGRDPTYQDLGRLDLMDRCITETLRMWPAVAVGTYRQLQFDDTVKGPGGQDVLLPKGTAVNIVNWSRHRNPDLWGPDANDFNPRRSFKHGEMAKVGCPMAAMNPSSERFSPFAHSPRSCLGRNFAQMEMRLIMLYLLRDFSFELGSAYKKVMTRKLGATPSAEEFRGINRATMGPMDLESSTKHSWGTRPLYALKLVPRPRAAPLA